MHDLVAVQPQERGAEQLLRIGVDHHLHETQRLARFARPRDPGHRHFPGEQPPARLARFGLAHPGAAERRIDE